MLLIKLIYILLEFANIFLIINLNIINGFNHVCYLFYESVAEFAGNYKFLVMDFNNFL